MVERKPYPFFCSVEFLTVLCKVFAAITLVIPAILSIGLFTVQSALLLIGAILEGFLLAAKELEIHQNLYTNEGFAGRDKKDAIANIQQNAAVEMASQTDLTVKQILKTTPVDVLVDFAVKPSLGNAAAKLATNLLRSIF